nr:helix-turn-helix domain-containing protein [uncultured Acetatifactor sp.]
MPKEYEIICLLTLNRGQTFERGKIYDRVWGLEGSGDDTVIMEHIHARGQI